MPALRGRLRTLAALLGSVFDYNSRIRRLSHEAVFSAPLVLAAPAWPHI